ncbi:MAG: STAS domain-containing protein [Burkholderiales bacterium]|nr:STAS domain-containing protein [Burkholderiales bacterium]MDE1928618.1 STAS domain-containing protein [Burkholderiales bacterium]MDE2502785.1 STAS domain-containing protein [Burkholderiales bacterium]
MSVIAGPMTAVKLSGRLDAAGAESIALRFTAGVVAAARPAVVDLAEVGFVASMGLRLFISSARALGQKGHRLALFGAVGMVQEVLVDAAIDQILPITETLEQAIAAVRA